MVAEHPRHVATTDSLVRPAGAGPDDAAGDDAAGRARSEALDRYAVMDTAPEQGFDDIALLASDVCETPVALVSLIAQDRQWFKARVGFPPYETSLEQSVCAHAIRQGGTVVIPDLLLDERTKGNTLVVGDPRIRFYAGAVLETPEGVAIGTLCVIDVAPRPAGLTEAQRTGLEALARQVMAQLEMRRLLARMVGATRDREMAETADQRRRDHDKRRRGALLELGDRLGRLDDVAEMAFTAAEILGRTLDASAAGYVTVDAGGDAVVVERDWSVPGVASVAGRHRMADHGLFIEDLRRGETVVIADVEQDARTAVQAAALVAISMRALIDVPLIEHGRLVAFFFVSDSGPRFWTADTVSFVRNVAGRTRAAVERRRAEAGLRDLAASLEQQVAERTADRNRLWQLSTDIMLVARFDGTMTAVNPAWTALLGWSEAELVGRTLFELIHPDDMAATLEGARSVAGGTSLWEFRNRYRHRDGSYRWISWTAVPGDGLINAVGRDITAERERAEALALAEERLRQSQKMEAVGQLTGGLAHDFNNLLAGISGSLELIQARIGQGRVKDVDRFVQAAQGAAKRAASLTHRLLAFSRQQTLAPRPIDVNRLVAGMEDLVRRTVGPEIAVVTVAAGGLWTTLCDPSQLENALLNLCINARDAMPEGGTVTIETGNAWLDERAAREREVAPGQYVSLCVRDDGTGMSAAVAARAFDPFFTTKPTGLGTGLGLSMIYGFARQTGGQARIMSEVGRGTTVCLYLPRHDGDAEQEGAAAEPYDAPRAGAEETVLVVDDEPTVRMLVVEVLEDLGYRAIEAHDGAAGLTVLQSGARIDLLVTDVGLPGGMNGRQVADAGRVLRPGLKVLFITGYAENAVLSDGYLEPGMQVLTKPFALEALASGIKGLIAGS